MDDEISLRDIYLILKRSSRMIFGLSLATFLVVFGLSYMLPSTYESEAMVQALVLRPANQGGSLGVANIFRTLPEGKAMGLGFNKQIKNKGPYVINIIGNTSVKVKSSIDYNKNILTISVLGHDAAETQQFVEELLAAFNKYVRDQAYGAANASLNGALEQARLDAEALQAKIEQLRQSLSDIVPVKNGPASQAVLESNNIPPNVARADNPALAYVSLELAKQQTYMASLEAEINALQRLATNPEQLRRLSEQAARVNVLSPPSLPQEPVAPRPVFNAVLAAVLAFMAAVFWAFIGAALAEESETSVKPTPVSPASPSEAASLRQ